MHPSCRLGSCYGREQVRVCSGEGSSYPRGFSRGRIGGSKGWFRRSPEGPVRRCGTSARSLVSRGLEGVALWRGARQRGSGEHRAMREGNTDCGMMDGLAAWDGLLLLTFSDPARFSCSTSGQIRPLVCASTINIYMYIFIHNIRLTIRPSPKDNVDIFCVVSGLSLSPSLLMA